VAGNTNLTMARVRSTSGNTDNIPAYDRSSTSCHSYQHSSNGNSVTMDRQQGTSSGVEEGVIITCRSPSLLIRDQMIPLRALCQRRYNGRVICNPVCVVLTDPGVGQFPIGRDNFTTRTCQLNTPKYIGSVQNND